MEAACIRQITAGYINPSSTYAFWYACNHHETSGKLLKHGHLNQFLSQTSFLFTKLLECIVDSDNNQLATFCYDLKRLKAKLACHPARCLLPVEIMETYGLATGPATVELMPYLLPY